MSRLSVCVLLPLTVFVALSPVLSPQFHLWLAPWAALALLSRDVTAAPSGASGVTRAAGAIFLATFLVPVFFPSPTFDTGLDASRTVVLLLRNGLLVYAAGALWRVLSRGDSVR